MKTVFSFVVVSAILMAAMIGCKAPGEPGVSSDYRSQWTKVAVSPAAAADAAKTVLASLSLSEVEAHSTGVDGVATGKKADGTVVRVNIKGNDTASEISVTVGTLGDPSLGSEIAEKIKAKAEGK